ncbi:DUF4091 domain-containing protein [Brachybacterium sp. NBEC-018]|uniref:DUF4091 domain-containing protein n=1 Tax=Brachybacterium sp. NBEC-018 TaxID=2996004 RepID=UPI0021751746|nr:DUF4091 domain-containing protein [Brachybacterium sp. NBEC-018]UVY82853.1 DUF4091 domain-containing protein [Brachybacterium sp. NBEC-018]
MQTRLTDSLEKVLGPTPPRPLTTRGDVHVSGFLGERLSLQLAVLLETGDGETVRVGVGGPLAGVTDLSAVRRVPVSFAAPEGADAHYLVTEPGEYPDLLEPAPTGPVSLTPGTWEALWIDVLVTDPGLAGDHDLEITVESEGGCARHRVRVRIHPRELPPLALLNTHWFHADSLAVHYDVPLLGERHWELIEAFLGAAREMDVNSVLTPVWTPPLDTAVGHERPTVQLVGIEETGPGEYRFDLTALDRWLALCEAAGFRAIELAHLFTQWGAKATPKIVVDTPAGPEKRFGWHVPATDPSYRRLLEQMIPVLRAHLETHWPGEVLWHLSDEPGEADLEGYRAARAQVADLLDGAQVVDALSSCAYAAQGLVATPVVATDHVRPFLEAGLHPWVYYCVSQGRDVANRFIALPSVRSRVLGRQLFVHGAPGFLHWGFNFWWTQHALAPVDPFTDTCAGGAFPGGDASVVYPGPDGTPWPSIRHRVLAQAMADHRALTLLAGLAGRDAATALVDEGGTLAYDRFSYDVAGHLAARAAVDEAILAHLGTDGAGEPGTDRRGGSPGGA